MPVDFFAPARAGFTGKKKQTNMDKTILMKNKQNHLGEEISDENVIPLFMVFLESIFLLPGSGNKAKACFRRTEVSSKLCE